MHFLKILICTILLPATLSAQHILWEAPISVANQSFGSTAPRIGIFNDGSPAVLWGISGTALYFSQMPNGATAFQMPVSINTNGVNPGIFTSGGIDLAIADDNTCYVVFENFQEGIFVTKSTDKGISFQTPVTVLSPPSGYITTLPSIVLDENQNPIVSYIYEVSAEIEGQYYINRSLDGGQTFGPPAIVGGESTGQYVCECCPSDLLVQGDSVFLAYRANNFNIRDMQIARSIGDTLNFNHQADVDGTDWEIFGCPISGPRFMASGDSLVTTFMSRGTGLTRVHLSTTKQGDTEFGHSFYFPYLGSVAPQQNHPDIAGHGDTIAVAWEEVVSPQFSLDIRLAFSATGAADLRFNSSILSEGSGAQQAPAIAYKNGVFHLVYENKATGMVEYRRGTVTAGTNNQVATQQQFQVYPNPICNADDMIQLVFDGYNSDAYAFQLKDMQGKMIKTWEKQGGNQVKLELPRLVAGPYVLEVLSRDGVLKGSRKIVRQ